MVEQMTAVVMHCYVAIATSAVNEFHSPTTSVPHYVYETVLTSSMLSLVSPKFGYMVLGLAFLRYRDVGKNLDVEMNHRTVTTASGMLFARACL